VSVIICHAECLLGGRRGQMTLLDGRLHYEELINAAILSGASKYKACDMIGMSIRTFQNPGNVALAK
jgi:hypothetical protein